MRGNRVIFSLLLCTVPGNITWAQQRPSNKCVSVKNILDYLALHRKSPNTFGLAAPLKDVRERGFCSRPSPDEMNRIRKAGASPELIDAIDPPTASTAPSVATGPSPAPPPPPKEGRLHIVCQPVDCNATVVGGKALGATTKGELSATLPAGPISVAASQQDYDSEPKFLNVEIKDHETTTVDFKLSVSPDALLREGKKQFSEMIAALGGDDGLKALSFFRASGSLQCYDRTGQQTAWDISSAIMKPPAHARFEVVRRGKKGTYIAANTERGLEWDKTEKSPQFDELDIALQRFEEQQISRLIERFKNGEFKMIASELSVKPGDETVIRAEGGGKVYRIRIGVDRRPREITFEAGMLEKGLKISYSDYADRVGTAYPMSMQIQYPDAERHGLAITFRTLDLNPS